MREETISGSDNVAISPGYSAAGLRVRYRWPGLAQNEQNLFIALRTHREIGTAVLPFARHAEGSTVFLPFKSDLLLSAEIRKGQVASFIRRWERWRWSEREPTKLFEVSEQNGEFVFQIPRTLLGDTATVDFASYTKDPQANDGWGWFWACSDRTVDAGTGDKYIPHSVSRPMTPIY